MTNQEWNLFKPAYRVYDSQGHFICSYGTGWSLKDVMTGSGRDVHKVALTIHANGSFVTIAEFLRKDFKF